MAKKIFFSLEMENGVKVRTIKELKENFSLVKVIEYFLNGKLRKWLLDRNYIQMVHSIDRLNINDNHFVDSLCDIFNIENYTEIHKIDIGIIERNIRKKEIVQMHTNDEEVWRNINDVATNQIEFDEILENIQIHKKIYIVGEKFKLKKKISKIEVIGVGNPSPKLIIMTNDYLNLLEAEIIFQNVNLNESYNENKKKMLEKNKLKKMLEKAKILQAGKSVSYANKKEEIECKSIAKYGMDLEEVLNNFQNVANSQEELDKLLKKRRKKIYLYNGKYVIQKDIKNVELIAIGNVKLGIKGIQKKSEFDSNTCINNNVKLTNITYDDVYEQLPCYITTAICESKGKSDTCYELEMFRMFRDKWLIKTAHGKKLVEIYYLLAPQIVSSINRLPHSKNIYENLWNDYLSKCLYFIEKKDYYACQKKYCDMVNYCKVNFLSKKQVSV